MSGLNTVGVSAIACHGGASLAAADGRGGKGRTKKNGRSYFCKAPKRKESGKSEGRRERGKKGVLIRHGIEIPLPF